MILYLYKKYIVILLIFVLLISLFIAPLTGLSINKQIKIKGGVETEGYILFAPERSTKTYLINYDTEVVYSWDSTYNPGFSAYLLGNGDLLRTSYLGSHPTFFAGGMAGGFQQISHKGDIIWEYKYSDTYYLTHHDIEPLPNGNVLIIAWEYKSPAEAEKAGRDPSINPSGGLWPDHIIEVNQTGPTSGNIVWKWHVWDHLIQDYDPDKDNYGVIAEHPELIDINYGITGSDWLHTNSIDYNEEFDQIIISVRNFNEIWVIDHSTTMEEAAGHTGGYSGKGGDILYRWGNPVAYQAGTISDQKFFSQHDANWIESGCPGEGNILVFNNGNGRPDGDYSSVDEIIPPVDDEGNYYLEPGESYEPDLPTWTFKTENPEDFFSATRSGAQRLPDGDTIICDSEKGYFFEITSDGDIIWDYENPYPDFMNNIVFKIIKYPLNYPGLDQLFQPPQTPKKPSGPNIGSKDVEYIYSSYTSDPNENDIYYLFDWDDGTDSGWLGPHKCGETCTANHIWYNNGSYDVKVVAKDIYDYESDWSNPLNVIIGNVAPDKPTIDGPLNGDKEKKYDYTFNAIDPNDDNIKYNIYWGDGISNISDFYQSGTDFTISHSWTEPGSYVITAYCEDEYGAIGDESTFTITIKKGKSINNLVVKFLQIHPNVYTFIRYLLGY